MFNFNSGFAWSWLIFGGWIFSNILRPWPTLSSTISIGGFLLIAHFSKLNLKSIKKGDTVYIHVSNYGGSIGVPIHAEVIHILPNDKIQVKTLSPEPRKTLTIPITYVKTHI